MDAALAESDRMSTRAPDDHVFLRCKENIQAFLQQCSHISKLRQLPVTLVFTDKGIEAAFEPATKITQGSGLSDAGMCVVSIPHTVFEEYYVRGETHFTLVFGSGVPGQSMRGFKGSDDSELTWKVPGANPDVIIAVIKRQGVCDTFPIPRVRDALGGGGGCGGASSSSSSSSAAGAMPPPQLTPAARLKTWSTGIVLETRVLKDAVNKVCQQSSRPGNAIKVDIRPAVVTAERREFASLTMSGASMSGGPVRSTTLQAGVRDSGFAVAHIAGPCSVRLPEAAVARFAKLFGTRRGECSVLFDVTDRPAKPLVVFKTRTIPPVSHADVVVQRAEDDMDTGGDDDDGDNGDAAAPPGKPAPPPPRSAVKGGGGGGGGGGVAQLGATLSCLVDDRGRRIFRPYEWEDGAFMCLSLLPVKEAHVVIATELPQASSSSSSSSPSPPPPPPSPPSSPPSTLTLLRRPAAAAVTEPAAKKRRTHE